MMAVPGDQSVMRDGNVGLRFASRDKHDNRGWRRGAGTRRRAASLTVTNNRIVTRKQMTTARDSAVAMFNGLVSPTST